MNFISMVAQMEKENKQLKEENEELKKEIEMLKRKILGMETTIAHQKEQIDKHYRCFYR